MKINIVGYYCTNCRDADDIGKEIDLGDDTGLMLSLNPAAIGKLAVGEPVEVESMNVELRVKRCPDCLTKPLVPINIVVKKPETP